MDERFKVTSVPFFIPDFNLLSCELKNQFDVLLSDQHQVLTVYLNLLRLAYNVL